MYDPKLEELINAAVEDGVLTDTERQVLDKKALAMGCDLDEFHVILDGRLQKKQRELADAARQAMPAPPSPKPSSNKMGELKKCPHCNAVVPAGSVKCPECGYEFRNMEVVSSMARLQEKLDAINSSSSTGMFDSFSSVLGGGSERKQARTIRDFPVPNSKEDLLEFMLALKSRGDKNYKNRPDLVPGAYYTKYMECFDKVKTYYSDDPMFQPIIAEAEKLKKKWTRDQYIIVVIVAVIAIIILCVALSH